jgi:hypothetical protein
MVTDAFRTTILMENHTEHSENDKKIKTMIKKHGTIWDKILSMNQKFYKKELSS